MVLFPERHRMRGVVRPHLPITKSESYIVWLRETTVHHDPDIGVRRVAPVHRAIADELLDDHPGAEGHYFTRAPASVWLRVRSAQFSSREEPKGIEYGDQNTVMGEVRVNRAV